MQRKMQIKRNPLIIIEGPDPTLEEVNRVLDRLMGPDEPLPSPRARKPAAPRAVSGNGHRRVAAKVKRKVSRKDTVAGDGDR